MEGPRRRLPPIRDRNNLTFMGQVGAVDMWLDMTDPAVPFLVIYVDQRFKAHNAYDWAMDAEGAIQKIHSSQVHLTLYDECRIYTLCEAHKERKEA